MKEIQLVEHWPDDEWRGNWLTRFTTPSSENRSLVGELRTQIEPFLVRENEVPAEWIDFVPTGSSEWQLIPTLDSLSDKRWNSIRTMAKKFGEEQVFIGPVDLEISHPSSEPMVSGSFLVSTALSYGQLEESDDFDAINILWSNEVPYMIVGQSGAWALWTVAGSRADVSVLSYDPDQVSPKVKSDFAAFRLNASPENEHDSVARAGSWWRMLFYRRTRELHSFLVIPVHSDSSAAQAISRKILNFFKPAEGFFETDFPWSAPDTWPQDVAAAAERLCGKDPHNALSRSRDFTTSTEQEWQDFVAVSPHAIGATVFDEPSGAEVSLADCSQSIVVKVNRAQLKELRRAIRGRAIFHGI